MELEYIYTKNRLIDYINKGIAEIGDFTYGFPKILHWGEDAKLKIGKFCSIADEVVIFLGGNHRYDWITTYPFSGSGFNKKWPEAAGIKGHPATRGDVVIGNDVWIGYGVTILSGVTIGDGAVIGARSVVTKDVKPYLIIAGTPAKEVKKRFTEVEIEKMMEIKWWDWPEEKIKNNLHILCSSNINKILKFLDKN